MHKNNLTVKNTKALLWSKTFEFRRKIIEIAFSGKYQSREILMLMIGFDDSNHFVGKDHKINTKAVYEIGLILRMAGFNLRSLRRDGVSTKIWSPNKSTGKMDIDDSLQLLEFHASFIKENLTTIKDLI